MYSVFNVKEAVVKDDIERYSNIKRDQRTISTSLDKDVALLFYPGELLGLSRKQIATLTAKDIAKRLAALTEATEDGKEDGNNKNKSDNEEDNAEEEKSATDESDGDYIKDHYDSEGGEEDFGDDNEPVM